MTAKEEATSLILEFTLKVLDDNGRGINAFKSKQYALIAINNEINSIFWLSTLCNLENPMYVHFKEKMKKLEEIKKEIENYDRNRNKTSSNGCL
jgi:hypothetical protein